MKQLSLFIAIVIAIVCCTPVSRASLTPPTIPKAATLQEVAAQGLAEVSGIPQCPGVVQLRENGTYVVINLFAIKRANQFIPRAGKKGSGFTRLTSVNNQKLDVLTSIDEIVKQLKACKKGYEASGH